MFAIAALFRVKDVWVSCWYELHQTMMFALGALTTCFHTGLLADLRPPQRCSFVNAYATCPKEPFQLDQSRSCTTFAYEASPDLHLVSKKE